MNPFLCPGGDKQLVEVAIVHIVGLHRHNDIDLNSHQDCIKLKPEPENPHDSKAIAAQVDGSTVGHVSKVQTPRVHAMLNRGRQMHTMFLRYIDYEDSCAELLVGCWQKSKAGESLKN